MNNQVKSKERVSDFGEVNTSEREVNAMLDLVKQETERLDSRFLEPACGDGNFLIEVLNRKLEILVKKYKKNQYEFEKNAVVVIGSIYGVDILPDNAQSARDRLFDRFIEVYKKHFKEYLNNNLIKSIKFILDKNIIHGDALTLKQVDSENPVTFSEWAIINSKLKRRDFTLSDLIAYSPFEKGTLFSDVGEEVNIPDPIKEYPLVNYDEVFKTC
ncbi:SAM-dependent DNA methyltransferase [Gammaproteobacteria bacterium]|nr:SAM-dependent DNA methyltransferase [Gammaproteobacteria bacterium]